MAATTAHSPRPSSLEGSPTPLKAVLEDLRENLVTLAEALVEQARSRRRDLKKINSPSQSPPPSTLLTQLRMKKAYLSHMKRFRGVSEFHEDCVYEMNYVCRRYLDMEGGPGDEIKEELAEELAECKEIIDDLLEFLSSIDDEIDRVPGKVRELFDTEIDASLG